MKAKLLKDNIITTWQRQIENRRIFLKFVGLSAACLAVSGCAAPDDSASDPQDPKPHVLMVVIDDLNDWISILGHPTVKTPNLDRLARRGVTFNNA